MSSKIENYEKEIDAILMLKLTICFSESLVVLNTSIVELTKFFRRE
jgi:hypothetical protein